MITGDLSQINLSEAWWAPKPTLWLFSPDAVFTIRNRHTQVLTASLYWLSLTCVVGAIMIKKAKWKPLLPFLPTKLVNTNEYNITG